MAKLGEDRHYWGHVHFRTDSRTEHRDFSGELDAETFARVGHLIRQFAEHPSIEAEETTLDGLIGIGTRSAFRRIFGMRNGSAPVEDAPLIRAYHELLALLEPRLSAAIM